MVPERQKLQLSSKAVKALADSSGMRSRRSRINYQNNKCIDLHVGKPVQQRSSISMDIRSHLKRTTSCRSKTGDSQTFEAKKGRRVSEENKNLKLKQDAESKFEKSEKENDEKKKQTLSEELLRNGSSHKDRMLMRQWLEYEADCENIPGLKWLDKKEGLVKITWRHGSRAEWSTEDVTVFKCWAQHTGRYNSDDLDYKRWKANFRCALNSLADVKEVKERRNTKGCDPYKVYRLLPAILSKKRRRESIKSTCSSPENDCVTSEESIPVNVLAPVECEPLESAELLNQEMFLQLIPFSSLGYDQVLAWPSSNQEHQDNQEDTTMPLMFVDHSYASNTERCLTPLPFNATIPVPVQSMIETDDEFQPMLGVAPENLVAIGLSELLSLPEIQGNVISSTDDHLERSLESMMQVYISGNEFNEEDDFMVNS